MGRPLVIGANFKMNQTPVESAAFYTELARLAPIRSDLQLYVIPPFTSLTSVTAAAAAAPAPIWIGAQNMHWAKDGAFTGEISAAMLIALGIDLVLIGHAERRRLFHEVDGDLNRKVLAALEAGLRVLLCVGETAEEKGWEVGGETVGRQLKIALHGVEPGMLDRVLVAYEPVWSIGAAGTPALPDDVAPIALQMRETLRQRFGDTGEQIPILYGGSVDVGNAGTFVELPTIDGLLIGRAAWSIEGFLGIVTSALAARGAR